MTDRESPVRLLAAQFFRRFFDNDLVSPNGDGHEHLSTLLAIVAVPGLFVSAFLLLGYTSPLLSPGERLLTALPHKFLLFGCSMAVMALVTCIEWDALSLDARDEAILGPLPVPARTIVKAKLAALASFLALFAAAANAIPAFAWPLVFLSTVPIGFDRAFWVMGVHLLASLLASILGFLVIFAFRETARVVVGARVFRRVSGALQFAGVLAIASALLLLPALPPRTVLGWLSSERAAYLAPPMWFVGLEETLTAGAILDAPGMDAPAGRVFWTPRRDRVARAAYLAHTARLRRLAALAVAAILAVGALALIVFILGTRRAAAAPVGARHHGVRRWLQRQSGRIVVRHPQRQAGFFFTLQVMARSPEHRLHLAAYLAAGSATVLVLLGPSLLQQPGTTSDVVPRSVLAVQMVLIFFVVAGLRAICARPAALAANWVFQVCWTGDVQRYLSGVRRAHAVVLAGMLLALVPFHAWWLSPERLVAHFLAGWLAALIAAELMVVTPRRMPFTCATTSSGGLKKWWLVYVFAFVAFTSGVSAVEARALQSWRGTILLLGALVLLLAVTRVIRSVRVRRTAHVLFEEEPDLTQALGLDAT
jgi:hypothetical protein